MKNIWKNAALGLVLMSCTNSIDPKIQPNVKTIQTRIEAPHGYQWVTEPNGSYSAFLQQLPVLRGGTPD